MKIFLILLLKVLTSIEPSNMDLQSDTNKINGLRLTYDEYQKWIDTDTKWDIKAKDITSLTILNPEGVMILRGQEYVINGLTFERLETLKEFINLKELYLVNLFVDDIPESFDQLQNLERLEISFSLNADLEHAIHVISKIKSLKRINVEYSTITLERDEQFTKAMKELGIKVDSMFD